MKAAAVVFLAGALYLASSASVRAATEFCPAQLIGTYAKSSTNQTNIQHYLLRALGPRLVDGVIVAETDSGWYTWSQQSVQLVRTTYTSTSPQARAQFVVAESPEMSVSFPQPVVVQRAWLLNATTHDDRYFGWDAHGKVTCDPPDFAALQTPSKTVTTRTPQADDPTPGPAPPIAKAEVSAPPFAPISCTHPFVAANVIDPATPVFPGILQDQGPTLPAVAEIYVAVNSKGVLADAWIFASSGYPAMDDAALTAARKSRYAAPTSYCRSVSGTYLFRAIFVR